MKTLRIMLLLPAIALMLATNAQDAQFVERTFFADKNLLCSGLKQGADGCIYVCTSKESFPEDHNGVAIRRLMANGDLKDEVNLKLDMVQNFALTPDGGYLVLFNYDMFDDSKSVKMEYSNSTEFYDSDHGYRNMPGVVKLSKYGSLDWVIELKTAQYFQDNDPSSIFVTPANEYWVIFTYSEEDTLSEFGAQDDYTRAILMNSYGSIIFEKNFKDDDFGLLTAPVLQPDGRILLFSDRKFSVGRKLAWLDRQGNLTSSEPIAGLDGLYTHSIVAAGDNGFIYTGHQDEQNYIALVDKTGKMAWKNPSIGTIHVLAPGEDGVLALSTEKYMYSYKEGTPVNFTVTKYTYTGEVKPDLSFTHDGPVDFTYMLSTKHSVVMAGNVEKGDQKGVSLVVTIPSENSDLFRNMNTYNYKEYALAVRNKDIDRIRTLASFGVSPVFSPGTSGDTKDAIDNPLLLAFSLGYYESAEELLKAGADPDRLDEMPVRYFFYEIPQIYNLPLTPLMYIALTPDFYQPAKYMDLLKKYNADFSRITRDGNAFDQAFHMQYIPFLDLFNQYLPISSSDLEKKMENAIENDLPTSLKWTLDHGANPNNTDFMGNVIIDKGFAMGSKEVKAVLKEWQKTHKK